MIEIIFVYMLGKRMGTMLRLKGYEKPFRYQLLVPIWWFTGEIAGAFLSMFIRAVATGAKELVWNFYTVYPAALIGALLSVTTLFLIVRRVPVRQGNSLPASPELR